jgi:hypothetical protein
MRRKEKVSGKRKGKWKRKKKRKVDLLPQHSE